MKIITFRDYSLEFGFQDNRLYDAAQRLKDSLSKYGIEANSIYSDDQYITVKETLETARSATKHSFFIWCNTDVIWNIDPFKSLPNELNYGFHRLDTPSNVINYGVDAYRINNDVYDTFMKDDIPHMLNGCSHTDWYISRALMHFSKYINQIGYIEHPEHPRYPGSAGISEMGQQNIRNFNEWADRHGVSKI